MYFYQFCLFEDGFFVNYLADIQKRHCFLPHRSCIRNISSKIETILGQHLKKDDLFE